jgi:hypothetical protein
MANVWANAVGVAVGDVVGACDEQNTPQHLACNPTLTKFTVPSAPTPIDVVHFKTSPGV